MRRRFIRIAGSAYFIAGHRARARETRTGIGPAALIVYEHAHVSGQAAQGEALDRGTVGRQIGTWDANARANC